nr:CARDB domain-containing protein [Cohnella nanjingensis]
MIDPYTWKNWLDNYNSLTGKRWSVSDLLDYAVILSPPRDFSPGSVQMWSIGGDGKWWYQTFTVKPLIPIESVPTPSIDLTITKVLYPDAVYVNDPVTITVTAKNIGDANSGAFDVGLFGVTVPNKRVANLAPSATTNVTFNTSFPTKGMQKLTAKVDITGMVVESNEENNTFPFQIMVNAKGDPVAPIAIISHLEGDNRDAPTIYIKPKTDAKLGDEKSYSPDGKPITKRDWKYTPPGGTVKTGKPTDFSDKGTYLVELKVTNSAGKESEWTQLTVKVQEEPKPPDHPDPPEICTDDPDPHAKVTGITRWIAGKPFPYKHHLNNSYLTGNECYTTSLDRSKDEVRMKKSDFSTYTYAFPDKAPSEPGLYDLEGKVYTTTGKGSAWDKLVLEIVAPSPPVVNLIAPPETYRNVENTLYIQAESPDNDIIEHLVLEERYDHNNDGSFEDEPWTTLYDGDFKLTYKTKYTTVGKRQYRATVTADTGLTAVSPTAVTNVLNQAPIVNFNAYGITQQPSQDPDSGPPVTNYTPDSIKRSWILKSPYLGGSSDKVAWKTDSTAISTKTAVRGSFAVGYPDAGLGPNARSKYNLASDLKSLEVWSPTEGVPLQRVLSGHRIITFNNAYQNNWVNGQGYSYTGEYRFALRDAQTGNIIKTFTKSWQTDGAFMTLAEDENLYFISSTAIKVFDATGAFVKEYPLNAGWIYRPTPLWGGEFDRDGQGFGFYLSKDREYFIIAVGEQAVKYSIRYNTIIWNITDSRARQRAEARDWRNIGYYKVNGGSKIIVANNGDTYLITGGSLFSSYFNVINKIHANSSLGEFFEGAMYFSLSVNDSGSMLAARTMAPINTTGGIQGRTFQVAAAVSSNLNSLDLALAYGGEGTFGDGFGAVYPAYPIITPDTFDLITAGSPYNNSPVMKLPSGQKFSVQASAEREDRYNYNLPCKLNVNVKLDSALTTYKPNWTFLRCPNNEAVKLDSTPILPDGSLYIFPYLDQNFENKSYVLPMVPNSGGAGAIREVDADSIEIFTENWGGLFYDPASKMINQTLEFNVAVNDPVNDRPVGAAIQIQDEKNMYAVEWSRDMLSLFRVVGGAKTLLQSTPLNRAPFAAYAVKLESAAGTIRVFVNGVKWLEANDSTFTRGSAGIMSLSQQQAVFSNVKRTNYGTTVPQPTYETALVGDPIMYEKLFSDIESDPKRAEEWTYVHNPNYFANPEGISVYNGRTFNDTINVLDKPGKYDITYRAQDDPGMEGYRLFSEPITKSLYVHRRPVAVPNVLFTGVVYPDGEALDYLSGDQSYDLDVPGRFQDRLFRTRWADEETWTKGQRNFYNRPGVELIIQEQVQDIHGAWSYWAEQRIVKDALGPVNQTKPSMVITVPSGTAANPSVYLKDPTTYWNYYDAQNDPQEMYNLNFTYVDNGETAFYLQQVSADKSFEAAQGTFDTGRIIKVQGRVFSKGAWSDPSNVVYFIINKPPTTTLLNYNGPDADHPIFINYNQPVFQVSVTDPERDPIKYVDYETFLADLGLKGVDTETSTSAMSYKPPTPLPEGLQLWRARAHDGYQWGPYSTNGFYFVDTVQPEDTNEVLEIKPTSVKVTFDAFKDAAPSSGHDYRRFCMQKVNADGSMTNIDLDGNGTTENYVTLPNASQSYQVNGLLPGQTYRLMVVDWDRAGNMGKYEYIYFVTNRPPTGDFAWTPTLVYEGDTVTFLTDVDDPDRDELDVSYELTSPSGTKKSYSYTLRHPYPTMGPTLRMMEVGEWAVTMTVSDRIAPAVTSSKAVRVWPLGITGAVRHTEAWEANRLRYNAAYPDAPRPANWFWAGEAFMLEASVTDTGASLTKPLAVTVEAEKGLRADLKAQEAARPVFWKGTILSRDYGQPLSGLPEGPYTFTFKVKYSNGIEKIAEAGIRIQDTIDNYVQVHRLQ